MTSYELHKDVEAKKTMISGTGWQGSAEMFRTGCTYVVMLILATLLDPADFGVVGMTDVFVSFFMIFMAMGFDSAIVQQQQVTNEMLSTIFWLNVGLGTVMAIIGALISPALGWFYAESRVVSIFAVLSLSFVLQGLSVVQRGLLQRQLSFRRLALVDAAATFIASLAAIVTASLGGEYWSLVVLQLAKNALAAIGYWFSSPWRPRLVLDVPASMSCIRFSANLLAFNFLNFLTTRSDVILIGRLLGPEQLGLYLLAHRLVIKPTGQVLIVVGRTLYPILSALQDEPRRVREMYIKVVYTTFSILAPLIAIVAIVSPVLLPYQLGAEWAPLVPILIVWCLGALRSILASRVGILYLVMGRPDLQWKYQAIAAPIVIAGLVVGVRWGALGTSLSYNVAQTILAFLGLYLGFSLIDLKLTTFFAYFKHPFMALFGQILVGGAIAWYLAVHNVHPYLYTALVGLTALLAYGVVLYKLDPLTRQLSAEGLGWLSKKTPIPAWLRFRG